MRLHVCLFELARGKCVNLTSISRTCSPSLLVMPSHPRKRAARDHSPEQPLQAQPSRSPPLPCKKAHSSLLDAQPSDCPGTLSNPLRKHFTRGSPFSCSLKGAAPSPRTHLYSFVTVPGIAPYTCTSFLLFTPGNRIQGSKYPRVCFVLWPYCVSPRRTLYRNL